MAICKASGCGRQLTYNDEMVHGSSLCANCRRKHVVATPTVELQQLRDIRTALYPKAPSSNVERSFGYSKSKRPSPNFGYFARLPNTVTAQVLHHLDPKSLANFSAVSKATYVNKADRDAKKLPGFWNKVGSYPQTQPYGNVKSFVGYNKIEFNLSVYAEVFALTADQFLVIPEADPCLWQIVDRRHRLKYELPARQAHTAPIEVCKVLSPDFFITGSQNEMHFWKFYEGRWREIRSNGIPLNDKPTKNLNIYGNQIFIERVENLEIWQVDKTVAKLSQTIDGRTHLFTILSDSRFARISADKRNIIEIWDCNPTTNNWHITAMVSDANPNIYPFVGLNHNCLVYSHGAEWWCTNASLKLLTRNQDGKWEIIKIKRPIHSTSNFVRSQYDTIHRISDHYFLLSEHYQKHIIDIRSKRSTCYRFEPCFEPELIVNEPESSVFHIMTADRPVSWGNKISFRRYEAVLEHNSGVDKEFWLKPKSSQRL